MIAPQGTMQVSDIQHSKGVVHYILLGKSLDCIFRGWGSGWELGAHPRSLWKFEKFLESVQTFAEENILSHSLRESGVTRDHSGTSRSFICSICQEGFVKRYYARSHVMTLHQVGTSVRPRYISIMFLFSLFVLTF